MFIEKTHKRNHYFMCVRIDNSDVFSFINFLRKKKTPLLLKLMLFSCILWCPVSTDILTKQRLFVFNEQ